MATLIRLDAGNDINGNPRRCYYRVDWERMRHKGPHVWDEGYHGVNAVPSRLRLAAIHAPTFATTPKEYRALVRGD